MCTFPDSPWGIWNPYETADNSYTPGGTYTQLDDQTGQSKHMVPFGSAPDASLEVFPGKDGLTSLPQCTGVRRLRYNSGSDEDLMSFTTVYAGAYSTVVLNTGSEYQLVYSNASILLTFEQGEDERRLSFRDVGDFGPAITGIPSSGGGEDAWLAYAVRCTFSGVFGEPATWRVIAVGDMDDGNGVRVFGDETFVETDTTTDGYDKRERFRGVLNEGNGDKGLFGIWLESLSDNDLITSLGAAVCNIDKALEAQVVGLLGVPNLCPRIRSFVPPWMREPAKPYLCAFARPQRQSRIDARSMFAELEPGSARGIWLDLLGRSNFGIPRRTAEPDVRYARRIMTPAKAVTEPHLLAVTTELLADFGYGAPIIVPWYEGGHFLSEPDTYDYVTNTPGGMYLDFSHLPMINGFEIYVDASMTDVEKADLGALLADRVALGCRFQILDATDLLSPSSIVAVVTEGGDAVVTEDADPVVAPT